MSLIHFNSIYSAVIKKIIFLIIFCHTCATVLAQNGIRPETAWEFLKGDSVVPQATPVYGKQGKVTEGNKPGARQRGVTWVDASGNQWLFGGLYIDSISFWAKYLNDLWKYDPNTDQWTFMKGDNGLNVPGVYGIRGVPSDENRPGGRSACVSWVDEDGNLWLFGGTGYNRGNYGYLNDLWKYNVTTNQWTWVHGDNAVDVPTVYGSKGIAAATNQPGGRTNSISWSDTNGNLWLFGGGGYTHDRTLGMLNDLWKYNVITNQWTWMKGDSLTMVQTAYGSLGVTSSANDPGSRAASITWTDNAGNLLLFGGYYVKMPEYSYVNLSDLWKYDTATNNWTWIKGDSTRNAVGVYGVQGVGSITNNPKSREGGCSFKDGTGNLWMFGGERRNSNGQTTLLNDLWKYEPSLNQWTWMKGDSTFNAIAVYGTQSVAATLNKPEAKAYPMSWTANAGSFWIFGGGTKPTNLVNHASDLWKYDPPTNNWAWMKGDTIKNVTSFFGEQGYVAEGNSPGAREGGVMWKDLSGNLWLFGGDVDTVSGISGFKNDLWKYDVSVNQWIWMKGDSTNDNVGVYGTIGVAAAANKPGARIGSVSWTDASGILWLYGGFGFHTAGVGGYFNDLWKYDPSTNNWTWVKGDNTGNNVGVYGTQGVANAANKPGGRYASVSWIDISGRLWLFGGYGMHTSSWAFLNDLWRYDPATNNWTWMKGDNTGDVNGVYGTQGTGAAGNKPGSRFYCVPWTDGSGDLWLFGGYGNHSSSQGFLNDLWKYNISQNQWTWMKGDITGDMMGVYGTQGTAATGNKPGGRYLPVGWKDGSGNLWMFGGLGYGENSGGNLNDLWKYDPATNQWAWIKGDKEANQLSEFGIKGVPSAETKPGGRRNSSYSADASGNFWLYGGMGNTANGENLLNGLFKYNPSTNEWAWMKGIRNASNQGVYGSQGASAANFKPGARSGAISWRDTSNYLWLFGGQDHNEYFNDLWRYDVRENQWAWMKGDSIRNQFAGVYGTQQVPATGNKPGARNGGISWTDTLGKLWMFGGMQYDGVVTNRFNDLWKHDPITNNWAWMKGDNTVNQFGVYGTVNVAAAGNKPGARDGAVSWTDAAGNHWMFGGFGYAASGATGYLNDLWKYNPSTNQWTWVKGNNSINNTGIYGVLRVAAAGNRPGARKGSVSWVDPSGNLWLFGGNGYAASGPVGYLNDLWKYNPATNQWTWMKGANTTGAMAQYGLQGYAWGGAGEGNQPGARVNGVSWIDLYGKLWLLGGYGNNASSTGYLNDLWQYNTTNDKWIWMKGDTIINISGKGDQPGARAQSISWRDIYGDLWLFGGLGRGTSGAGYLNDLWKIFGGTKYIFTGNGNWNVSSNWAGFIVPSTTISAGMDVIINHTIPGVCINTGSIVLENSGKLTVESQKALTIDQGSLSNSGFVIGPGNKPGTVIFTGADVDSLVSTGSLTTPLILQEKNMVLTGNTSTVTVNLLGGTGSRTNAGNSSLTLGNYNLVMDTASLITNNTNYIITNGSGRLIRRVEKDSTVLYPVGVNDVSYTPATITNTGTGPQDYSVGVETGVIGSGSTPVPVTTGNVNRSWKIEKTTPAPGMITVVLQWNLADEQSQFNRGMSYIAHMAVCPPPPPPNCDASYYDAVEVSAATGSNPFSQLRDSVTNFNSPTFIVTSQEAVYRFINTYGSIPGDGNWSNPLNWTNGQAPPSVIRPGMTVIIDPIVGNECIFTGTLVVQPGGKITVNEGKKLTVIQ